MNKILSIDLDCLWLGPETIFKNPQKKINAKMVEYVRNLERIKTKKSIAVLDHHEIVSYMDKLDGRFIIDNIDVHHDFYVLDHRAWLNPFGTRGSRIGVGNFFFQLMREGSIQEFNWIIPMLSDIASCEKELIENIGTYYARGVNVIEAAQYKIRDLYDYIFISVSPEWVPRDYSHLLANILCAFGISIETTKDLIRRSEERWGFDDNNRLIEAHRFTFEYEYKPISNF